jgi:hypothetical protein
MPRFKSGDPVYILPKFSHLYPGSSAIVRSATEDPHRPMFNTYVVEFGDGSTGTVFEFQIIDGPSGYQTIIAAVVFDSRRQPASKHARGVSGEQIVLQTDRFDVDLKLQVGKQYVSVIGQILERGNTRLLKQLPVELMKEGMPVASTTCDDVGTFRFTDAPRGSLNLLITIAADSVRILAPFTV